MGSLILTADVSSAGRIKLSRSSARVIGMCQRLIEGPLPSEAATAGFFGSIQLEDELQDDTHHWQSWIGILDRRKLGVARPSLVETCLDYDRVEIWTDPDPNAYLVLFQLLDALELHPDVLRRVSLAFPSEYVGGLSEEEFEKTRPLAQPCTSEHLDLASRAWHAHGCSTPKAWFALLHDDLAAMPGLRTIILRVLAELPSATNGLTATEAQLLALVGSRNANHSTVFTGYLQAQPRPTLDYWEAGRRILSLSQCDPAIIDGVEENSFSLELHGDKDLFAAYRKRTWLLSAIGQRILENKENLLEVIPINRWLGNTHLTPDLLWRWDGTSEALVEPP